MTDDDGEEVEPLEHDGDDDGPDPADPFADSDDETADDPFADLGGGEDDETADDPFADLGGGEDDETADDPFADIEGVEVEDDPFTDLDVGDGDPSTDFGPSDNTLFTDEGGSDLDEEAVWAQVEGDAGRAETSPELDEDPLRGTGGEGSAAVDTGESVVKKRSYCERCEYFSRPPEVSCTYPNSEIVELIDTGRFRVRNCPIVERRQSRDISSIAEGGGTTDPELEAGEADDPESDD